MYEWQPNGHRKLFLTVFVSNHCPGEKCKRRANPYSFENFVIFEGSEIQFGAT